MLVKIHKNVFYVILTMGTILIVKDYVLKVPYKIV